MKSTILPNPTRTFGASLFAIVALVTSSFLTPILMAFFDNRNVLALLPLPLFAALCAYVWAWVLYPGAGTPSYGEGRGIVIALLAYLSFAVAFSAYLDWLDPPSPARVRHMGVQLLLVAFIWTPFPWAALIVGALAGRIRLVRSRPRIRATTPRRPTSRVRATTQRWSTTAARAASVAASKVSAARAACVNFAARSATPTLLPAVTMVVSNGLLLAGTALGFLAARVGPASSGHHDDVSLLVFPACVALACGALGWLLGRWAAARVAARHRVFLLLASTCMACGAAVLFVLRVA